MWLRLPEGCRPVLPWFRGHYARTIHEFPSMRQRVMQDPLRIDHPYWADDPHLDLEAHLQERQLGPDADPLRVARLISHALSRPRGADRSLGAARPSKAKPLARAPRCSLNVRISSRREFDSIEVPAAVLTRLRESSGATVNDLILTLCGGGLRQYLLQLGGLRGGGATRRPVLQQR